MESRHPSVVRRILGLLFVALLALPTGLAGSPDDPELIDPAGDQAVTAGPLVLSPSSFDDVDIVAAWFQDDGTQVMLSVQTTAAFSGDMTAAFAVVHGPASVFGSTANGTLFTITATGTTATGVDSVTATQDGSVLTFTMPRASLGASGGDVLRGLVISTSRSDEGTLPSPATQDDESATDTTEAAARDYVLTRPAVRATAQLTVVGGDASEPFEGETGYLNATTGTVRFSLLLENTGSDVDTFQLAVTSPIGATAAISPSSVALDPGTDAAVSMTVTISGADGQAAATLTEYAFEVRATSDRAASATATARVTTPIPDSAVERTVTPAGLSFLTPMAETLRFDDAFGDYAELVLLALHVLLAILIVYLLMMMGRRPWVKVQVRPSSARGAPGTDVEMSVDIENSKKRMQNANISVSAQSPDWRAAMLLHDDQDNALDSIQAGEKLPVELAPRGEPGSRLHGAVRVRVPEAGGKTQVSVRANPEGGDGQELRRHGGFSKSRIRSIQEDVDALGHAPTPSRRPAPSAMMTSVKLRGVAHEPMEPLAGETVTTHATVHNNGDDARLRVELVVDGNVEATKSLVIAHAEEVRVGLQWQAGEGKNDVRIRVFTE